MLIQLFSETFEHGDERAGWLLGLSCIRHIIVSFTFVLAHLLAKEFSLTRLKGLAMTKGKGCRRAGTWELTASGLGASAAIAVLRLTVGDEYRHLQSFVCRASVLIVLCPILAVSFALFPHAAEELIYSAWHCQLSSEVLHWCLPQLHSFVQCSSFTDSGRMQTHQ